MRSLFVVILFSLSACTIPPLTFHCGTDPQCDGTPGGRCVGGYCAFPSSSCASGYLFDESAGKLGKTCTPPDAPADAAADMVSVDMSTPPDLAPSVDLAQSAPDMSTTPPADFAQPPPDLTPPPPTCSDGIKNGNETDVDCGGSCPAKCASGKACSGPGDCASRNCASGICQQCAPAMVAVPKAAGGVYCIDATEVTAGSYQTWLNAGPSTAAQPTVCAWNTSYYPQSSGYNCSSSSFDPSGHPNHPVSCVDWCDAYAYCGAAGKRLCGAIGGGALAFASYADATASQWYNACSAQGGKAYPYGSPFGASTCNTAAVAGYPVDVASMPNCVGGYAGLFDMSGNVSEWEDSCDGTTGKNDNCRARGGGYNAGASTGSDCQNTGATGTQTRWLWNESIGFRCCSEAQ